MFRSNKFPGLINMLIWIPGKWMITFFPKHRQDDCYDLCLQKLVIQKCKCFFTGLYSLKTNVRACQNLTDHNCLSQQYFDFNVDVCRQSCPLECERVEYDVKVTTLGYPSKAYFEQVLNTPATQSSFQALYNQSMTYNTFKSHTVAFSVYYPSLDFTQISETPKITIGDLFSQIGGSLGLCVSYSILTFFEIAELVVLIIYELFKKNLQRKSVLKQQVNWLLLIFLIFLFTLNYLYVWWTLT